MAKDKKSRKSYLAEGLLIGLSLGALMSFWGLWFGHSWLGIGVVAGGLIGSAIQKEK